MAELSTISDIRDIVIIVVGILGVLALLVLTVFGVLIGLAVLGLIRAGRGTIRGGIAPILENARDTSREVRGSTGFVADSVVRPIIRVYGAVAGVRKALGVLGSARGGKGKS